jgi:uncharacterized OB-fold protein
MADRVPRTLPIRDRVSQPFWDGLESGKLLIQRCKSTGKYQWYPRAHSIHDLNGELEWVESRGTGIIHSFSIPRQTRVDRDLPYVYAIVEIDEGVRMTANIINTPIKRIRVGLRVKAAFEKIKGGLTLLQFEAV